MSRSTMLIAGAGLIGALFGPALFSLLSVLIYVLGGVVAIFLVMQALAKEKDDA